MGLQPQSKWDELSAKKPSGNRLLCSVEDKSIANRRFSSFGHRHEALASGCRTWPEPFDHVR